MIYLDHNATSPLRPEARAAMTLALEAGGNPSSVHAAGRKARASVETAREQVAALADVAQEQVIFTGGGTEADWLALNGAVYGALDAEARITRLFISAIEHDAVRANAAALSERVPGLRLETLPVTADGVLDLEALRVALREGKGRALVAVMAANNETGVIQPLEEIRTLTNEAGALLHVDAVQAAGKMALGEADYVAVSAHKLGGPQGVGALIVNPDAPFAAQVLGGGQEKAPARRHRECRRHCRLRRGGRVCRFSRRGAAHCAASQCVRRRVESCDTRRGRVRRGGAAAGEHLEFRGAGAVRRDGGDGAGSGGRDGEFGCGVLVRQGGALACAGGDGCGGCAGALRLARQLRLEFAKRRRRCRPRRIGKTRSPRAGARSRVKGSVMAAVETTKEQVAALSEKYKYGFVTDIEMERAAKGLNEDTVAFISAKKGEPEWMLEWRLAAYKRWREMKEPAWARVHYPKINYEDSYYYAAPKSDSDRPKSLEEVDPKLIETYNKLGIPLHEQMALAGVAVDAVFDSVSVATTFKETLNKAGVIFCPISEAIRDYPEMVRKYLGTVVPVTDNFFATLNSAVFSDGTFVYVPKGVRCPMELSTYFRINASETGQFERTLIVADEGSYVSLSRRLHRAQARREPAACRCC